jgi:hypothetical protein
MKTAAGYYKGIHSYVATMMVSLSECDLSIQSAYRDSKPTAAHRRIASSPMLHRGRAMRRRKVTTSPQERGIMVCGELCRVIAHRISTAVWCASGTFNRRTITTNGRTASDAFNAWKSKVESEEFN